MSDKPKLFALLVAIDKYAYPVGPLAGCVNDIHSVADYLRKEENDFDLHLQVLTDKEATRAKVEEGFLRHLAAAGEGDVAMFYYSGHGAQEAADTAIWRFEPDGKLEGLVLYDSIPDRSGPFRLLADKELRYLIHQVYARDVQGRAKADPPHILTVFDCCHSGENTRNIFALKEGEAIRERRFRPEALASEGEEATARMSAAIPTRRWEDFLFAGRDNITPERLASETLAEVLPEGLHVQMAACRSDESAFEVRGSGVFTSNLLDVLRRSRGSVSYFDLRSRLRHFIKNQFRQTPQIFEAGARQQIFRTFLNKSGKGKPLYGNIVHNPRQGWTMDLGAIHGVSRMARQVTVHDPASKTRRPATIRTVRPGYTLLDIEDAEGLDDKATLYGVVENFLSAPVHVFIHNTDRDEDAELRLRHLVEQETDNIFISEEEKQADYTLQMQFGTFALTLPGDRFRPLVLPVDRNSPDPEPFVLNQLRHISQWEFVRSLHNDGPNRLAPEAIRLEVFRVRPRGELEPLPVVNEEVVADLEPAGAGLGGKIRIKITNLAPFPVNVALLYLGRNFEVYTELLSHGVQRLDGATGPGKDGGSVWVFDGSDVDLDLERAVELFRWPYSETYFKLIASREEIDVRRLQQEELPDPALLADAGHRGIVKKAAEEENVAADAWMTRLVSLRLPNPRYDRWMDTFGRSATTPAMAPYVEGLREEAGAGR